MNVADAIEWFLIIAASLAGVSGVVVLAAAAIPPLGAVIRPLIAGQELVLAALCATGLMAGSLFLSEAQGYIPCEFCWYQRIAAYPLAVMLVIAVIRRGVDNVWPYVLGFAIPGALLSVYHIALQEGLIDAGSSCDPANPCTAKWAIDDKFAFVTIPFMALFGFVFIIAMAVTALQGRNIDRVADPAVGDDSH